MKRNIIIGTVITTILVMITVIVVTVNRRASHGEAERAIHDVVTALIKGDHASLAKFQYGDELDRLGVSQHEFDVYRKNYLAGYLSNSSTITVTREANNLPKPRNDYEKNMQKRIRDLELTRPRYTVTITRDDGGGTIDFPMYAVKAADGWRVSPSATFSWMQNRYSKDPKVRYQRILNKLKDSNLKGMCSPSGTWFTAERITQYLKGDIAETEIYGPAP